jgi:hypothetical protein
MIDVTWSVSMFFDPPVSHNSIPFEAVQPQSNFPARFERKPLPTRKTRRRLTAIPEKANICANRADQIEQ